MLHSSGSVLSWQGTIWLRTVSLKLHPPDSPPIPWLSFSGSVMVNFMCQHHWAMRCRDICPNITLGFLCGCFWMRLTFKKEDWVKEIGPNGGGCHPINWRHEKNKKADLPLSKRIPPAWQPLNWDIGCFLLSESNWSLLVFVLELYHQLSRDPDCWLTLQILGLVSFYNHTRKFPMINLFLHIHICTLLVLFFWRTITNSIHRGF